MTRLTLVVAALLCAVAAAQPIPNDKLGQRDKFRQLDELLPTPTERRLASGAPGPRYWQQKVDYDIRVTLDDAKQSLRGDELITYHNRSPHTLEYLWVQLDANLFRPDSLGAQIATVDKATIDKLPSHRLKYLLARATFDGGVTLHQVADAKGKTLRHTVVDTMMRVDLPTPLQPGASFQLRIGWSYRINNAREIWGRTGYEHFPKEDNYLYEIAQWFPRLAAYTDVHGWQNKPFLGRGEFTLEFGDYRVAITAPADHVVAATGVLQNPEQVLTEAQRQRLAQARTASKPTWIITDAEAKANEKSRAKDTKTWVFAAKNVRDFAWASSRKFAWDAMGVKIGDRTVMAMSFFPKEGQPLWHRYSTEAVAHTLEVVSKHTIDYPYPVAISVNGPVGGMEYPMICFNGPRPESDGTYSKRTKYGLITVIIHEVAHNWFPMIVNSDERRWTWMDEGLVTFVQFLAEREWEKDYPSRRGEARHITRFMKSSNQRPIMTHSQSILQFGSNAYAKPATALNVLRETVMGRELFDFAFKTYSRRWAFKRPTPADFFRTMEDASGVDLDWFWGGWFYTTEHTDLALTRVRWFRPQHPNPAVAKTEKKRVRDSEPESVTDQRNERVRRRVDLKPELADFYNTFDELDVTPADRAAFGKLMKRLKPDQRKLLFTEHHFYTLELENRGGLVMPVIVELQYADGSREIRRFPAEIWRRDSDRIVKLLMTTRPVEQFVLDPHLETADVDLENNFFPPKRQLTRFELFIQERRRRRGKNPMQKAREAEKKAQQKSGAQKPDAQKPDAKSDAPPARDAGTQ